MGTAGQNTTLQQWRCCRSRMATHIEEPLRGVSTARAISRRRSFMASFWATFAALASAFLDRRVSLLGESACPNPSPLLTEELPCFETGNSHSLQAEPPFATFLPDHFGVTGTGRAFIRPPCTTPPAPNMRLPKARRPERPRATRSCISM
mgnify:CR=1 FL=1|mmetsp:Transcript_16941/g.51252  ORF Transcript_16941/g.51252 Transcript_16941/m.51252 type:complete len:150 (+) Transcript_16941:386-835(+)